MSGPTYLQLGQTSTSGSTRGRDPGSRAVRHSPHHSVISDILQNVQLYVFSKFYLKRKGNAFSEAYGSKYTTTKTTELTGLPYTTFKGLFSKDFKLSEGIPLFGSSKDFIELSPEVLKESQKSKATVVAKYLKNAKSVVEPFKPRSTATTDGKNAEKGLPTYIPMLKSIFHQPLDTEDVMEGLTSILNALNIHKKSQTIPIKSSFHDNTFPKSLYAESHSETTNPPIAAHTVNPAQKTLNFFVKNSHSLNKKYLECKSKRNDPYSLEIDENLNKRQNRLIISQTGVAHLELNGNSQFSTLSIWLRDTIAFYYLKYSRSSINLARDTFLQWYKNVKNAHFVKNRRILNSSILFNALDATLWQNFNKKLEIAYSKRQDISKLLIEVICGIANDSNFIATSLALRILKFFEELRNGLLVILKECKRNLEARTKERSKPRRSILGNSISRCAPLHEPGRNKSNQIRIGKMLRVANLMYEAKVTQLLEAAEGYIVDWINVTNGKIDDRCIDISLFISGGTGEIIFYPKVTRCWDRVENACEEVFKNVFKPLTLDGTLAHVAHSKQPQAPASLPTVNRRWRFSDVMARIKDQLETSISTVVSDHQDAWGSCNKILFEIEHFGLVEPTLTSLQEVKLRGIVQAIETLEGSYHASDESKQRGTIRFHDSDLIQTIRTSINNCKERASVLSQYAEVHSMNLADTTTADLNEEIEKQPEFSEASTSIENKVPEKHL